MLRMTRFVLEVRELSCPDVITDGRPPVNDLHILLGIRIMANGAYLSAGDEFLVNATTAGIQTDSTITALAGGGFIMCWTDNSASGGDTSSSGIKARIYNASGAPVGGEFLVNTVTAGAQTQASVTALASGAFVVSWTDASGTGADPSQLGIKAQMFSASGTAIGSEFLVNTQTGQNQNASTITGLASGGFVVSWVDASGTAPDASFTGVRAQIYNASGVKVGGEFLVNSTTTNAQNFPALTSLASGGFVATWVDSSLLGGDNKTNAIKAQLFSTTGVKLGGEFLVNTTILGAQDQPTIASLSNGGFVVVWRDQSGVGDSSGSGLKAQIFNASGAKVGSEFQVNTTTLFAQDQPVVTAIPGGGFAVSWRDNSVLSGDPNGFGIKAQVFDNLGNKQGGEFQLNTTVLGDQQMPSIAALASGALVVGWDDSSALGGDPDGGIKARIFVPTTGTISDLALSNTVISEAAVENTTVASLTATGALNAAYTYQIISDSTQGGFAIDGYKLEVKDGLLLDYETSPTATLTIRATDTFGNSFDKIFSIAIANSVIENRYVGGEEALVNSATILGQQTPAITALSGSRYVVTWADASLSGGDNSGTSIKGQILDSDGNRIGTEFRINTVTANHQNVPAVTGLSSGGFVVTWVDYSAPGPDLDIKGQVYNSAGAAIGGEFLVNSSTLNAQKTPATAALAGGGFVITWADSSLQGGDASVSSVKAQLYDAAGNRVGGEFLVNTNTLNGQDTPVAASLTGGGFVISWHDSSRVGGDLSKDAVKAQIYDASGNRVGGEFLVNTETNGNQQQESITGLVSGGFVIAWADASGIGGDTDNYGIKLQIYDAAGNKVGGEILANATIAGAQLAPDVAALPNGGFIVSWTDYSGLGPEVGTAGIKAQIFAGDGTKVGGEFLVNTQPQGSQTDPVAAAAPNGSFAIAWTDYSGLGGDDSGTSIQIKFFHPLATQGGPPVLVANSDTLAAAEDVAATYQISALLANDTDSQGLPISLTGVTAVTGGTVALDGNGHVIFTPNANFSGAALFNYSVSDTAGNTAVGQVTVNVAPVNDPPTARADSASVGEDGGTISAASLLANDSDIDVGDTITLRPLPATTAAGAQLSLSSGVITYAPGNLFQYLAAGQTATDSFSYTIADAAGLTSTATVTLTVVGANDAPFGLALNGTQVDENAATGTTVGTLGASDVDQGDVLTYSLTNNAGGRFAINSVTGVITVANGGLLDYETAQSHGIVARATDGAGAFVESSLTIAVNNLPEPKSWTGDNGANNFTASTNDLWTLNGLGGADVLKGNASADIIYGGAGNDTLDGAGGADMLVGGTGQDIYYIDNNGDRVVENVGEGIDLVYASVNYTIEANIENLNQSGAGDIFVIGNDFANTINGNGGANLMRGGLGGDLLNGAGGNDSLFGEDGGDFIQGGDGNDLLVGGAGADELTGGLGADFFLFDSLTVSADRDKVKDFVVGEDEVQISRAVFTAFADLPAGALSASAFLANGGQAVTADQHLIYQRSTGNLYYDVDGVGGEAQVQIALFSTRPVLTIDDFLLV